MIIDCANYSIHFDLCNISLHITHSADDVNIQSCGDMDAICTDVSAL